MPPRSLFRLIPLGLVVLASAAFAMPPAKTGESVPQGLRTIETNNPERQLALTRGRAWQDFVARNGRWSVVWNEVTETPHRAFGSGIRLPGFAGTAASVDGALRRFMAGHSGLFGRAPELELVSARQAGRVWYVRYRQTVGGIPLLFTSWEFRVGQEGKLFAFGADAHRPPAELLGRPRVGQAVAREAAKQGIAFDPAVDRVEGGTDLYVLPTLSSGVTSYRLVYDVRVRTERPRGNWYALVDAATAEVVWRQNHVLDLGARGSARRSAPSAALPVAEPENEAPAAPMAAITGTVTGRIHPLLPSDALVTRPFARANVNGEATVTTGASGTYSMNCTSMDTIRSELVGPYVNVTRVDCLPADCDALFSLPTNCPYAGRNIVWDTSNSQSAERDVFYHSNLAHDYIIIIDPDYTASDHPIAMWVNSVDDECAAYWDSPKIIFGSEGSFCPYNMGTMPDVIYRMYGMRVNDDLYFEQGSTFGMSNQALQKGTADVMAAFMTDDPLIGNGIEGSGTYLRNLDELHRWPDDRSVEPNEAGLILGGAFWDLRQSIGLATTERLAHFAKYGLPGLAPPPILDDGQAMTEYFIETLVADDNNGDLGDGTPHFNEILTAFNAHGIGTNNFITIAHTPLEDRPDNGPFPINAVIQYSGQIGALVPSSPTLYYSVNGLPYVAQAMTPTGNPDEYGGEIPAQAAAIVRYYISAAEIYGSVRTNPAGAPTRAEHVFIAGPASTIIQSDMESNPGWTVGAAGDNATTGQWVRVNPNATIAQPGDDHTEIGDQCWVTGNGAPGEWDGTYDVDDGKTTLVTSTFDATQGGIIFPIISFYRWFSNNAGESPNLDYWRVDISNNNGGSWVPVENTLQTDQSWKRVVFFIKDYVQPTTTMKMRFVAEDAGNISLIEAAVDDWTMLAFFYPTGVEPGATTRELSLAPAAPNPFRFSTRLRYTLPAAGKAEIDVFDIHGRQVSRLRSEHEEAGVHSIDWDGRDQAGHRLPSGPYFVRLTQGGQSSRRAVVRIQ